MKILNKILLLTVFAVLSTSLLGQSASVTPSRLYFKVAPGAYKSQKIRLTNNGTNTETFKVDFADFSAPGNKGKTEFTPAGETNVRGCSQWLSASPSFVEIKPGETQDIQILLQVPNIPEANNARWAVATVKLTKENTGGMNGGSDEVGMRIVQTFQFTVHIFQTPPSITFKEAVITYFYQDTLAKDSTINLKMEVKNTGEAIVDCAPYLDVVNSSTGKKIKVQNKGFTVLPGGSREIVFKLPKGMEKGTYDILAIVDYGSDTDIAGAELKLKIE